MKRDAKLFFLYNKRWEPLAAKIDGNTDFELIYLLTIFQLPDITSKDENFAILSLSDEVDKIVEEYGGIEAGEKDLIRITLHEYYGAPLYGVKSNLIYLNKVINL